MSNILMPVGEYIIDDFLDNPDETREEILQLEYEDWVGYDNQKYKRVVVDYRNAEIIDKIEKHFGRVQLLGMGVRLNYNGELPNQLVHSDLGWGTTAMVLYMNPTHPEGSGTAFYTHKETGSNYYIEGEIEPSDCDDLSKWRLDMVVNGTYNRAIFYESDAYHSRFPQEAWGTGKEDGRLIIVAFFTPWEDL